MFFGFSSLPAFVWGNMTSCNYFVNRYITARFHSGPQISLFPFWGEREGCLLADWLTGSVKSWKVFIRLKTDAAGDDSGGQLGEYAVVRLFASCGVFLENRDRFSAAARQYMSLGPSSSFCHPLP